MKFYCRTLQNHWDVGLDLLKKYFTPLKVPHSWFLVVQTKLNEGLIIYGKDPKAFSRDGLFGSMSLLMDLRQ